MSEELKSKPPYLSYVTFKNYILSLGKGVVPTRIDKSTMVGQSGGNQTYLISALRFFNLIDEAAVPRENLHKLATATEVEQKQVWRQVFQAAYGPIISGLDLERATAGELVERFQKLDLTGETLRKCQSFFVSAAEAAGIELGPHLKVNVGRSSNGGSKRGRKSRPSQEDMAAPLASPVVPPPAPKKTMEELLLEKFPQFDPSWGADIQAQWFAAFQKLMAKAEDAKPIA